jgi:hypothetical protein
MRIFSVASCLLPLLGIADCLQTSPSSQGRRDTLRALVGTFSGLELLSKWADISDTVEPSFTVYQVIPDASAALDPSLKPLSVRTKEAAGSDVNFQNQIQV